jgi:hypothetical protein
MKLSDSRVEDLINLEQGDGVDVGSSLTQGLGHILETLLGRQTLLQVKVEIGLKNRLKMINPALDRNRILA